MKNKLLALVSATFIGAMMLTGIAFADSSHIENLKASYSNSSITVTGEANISNVIVQVWNAAHVLMAMDELSVDQGKINGVVKTGKLTDGSYTLKAADASGGQYEEVMLDVSNDDDTSEEPSSPPPATGGNPSTTQIINFSSNDVQIAISDARNGKATLEIGDLSDTLETVINIPVKQLRASNEVTTVELVSASVSVSIKLDMLGDSSNVELSIRIVDASELTEEVRKSIGEHPVYEFTLTADGKRISSFAKNDVELTMDYLLSFGEAPGKVVVYYIDENNQLQPVKNSKYDSNTGKIKFKPLHFSKYAAAYASVTFNDILKVEWAKDSIEALAAREIVNGMGNGSFEPNGMVTRAQFIQMLVKAFDLQTEASSTAHSTFTDVKPGLWHSDSIAAAQSLGIVNGKTEGSFGVDDEISRQDMVVMLYRTSQYLNAALDAGQKASAFSDQAEVADYAKQAVEAMHNSGLVNGVGQSRFAPNEHATRAMAATIIYRFFNQVE